MQVSHQPIALQRAWFVMVRSDVRLKQKKVLSVKCEMVVGARQAEVQQLLVSWDFHRYVSRDYAEWCSGKNHPATGETPRSS